MMINHTATRTVHKLYGCRMLFLMQYMSTLVCALVCLILGLNHDQPLAWVALFWLVVTCMYLAWRYNENYLLIDGEWLEIKHWPFPRLDSRIPIESIKIRRAKHWLPRLLNFGWVYHVPSQTYICFVSNVSHVLDHIKQPEQNS